MVTGIECAGIVLGILPLFIEAGKSYANGVGSLKKVAFGGPRDEELEEFYDNFHEQVVEMNEHISSIHSSISQTTNWGNFATPTEFFTNWKEDLSLERALRVYFGPEYRFDRFTRISEKIVELLGSLVNDKALDLSPKDLIENEMFQKLKNHASLRKSKQEQQMLQKLKEFALPRASNKPSTSYYDRARFFMGKGTRHKYLRKLQDCTEKLGKLISRAEKQALGVRLDITKPPGIASDHARSATDLSLKVRSLITNLHSALEKFWACTCLAEHKVRLRLSEGSYPRNEANVALDFLVSVHSTDSACRWQEAKVLLTPRRDADFCTRRHPDTLCELSSHEISELSLNFMIEDINGQQTMWQLPSKPRTFHFSERENPSSLYELLDGPGKMSRKEKLRLAITLSYSFLFLHDSDWLSRGWKKEDIFFFYKREDEPDYESPYLSARLTGIKQFLNSAKRDGAVVSPNEGILTLGILLLEIFEEKPIERWRTSKDKQKLYAFTDWDVAERVVEKMDPSPSQLAVRACLDWMREAAGEIRLESQDVRIKLFNRIIAPLEAELESLKPDWK